jgi:outer membrane protein
MKRLFTAAAAAFLLSATTAMAASVGVNGFEAQLSGTTDPRVDLGNDDWRGVIGGGVGLAPEFIGADDMEAVGLPLIDVEWRNAYFFSTTRGAGLNIIRRPTFQFGPRITYDQGRDSSDSTILRGLRDIEGSFEVGLFLNGYGGNWRYSADIRQGLGDEGHDGFVATLDLARAGQISEKATLIVGGFGHYASSKYLQAYFGVPTATANFARYTVDGGGLTDVGGYLNLVYSFTDNWFMSGILRGALLMGDAADSPVSQADGQYYFGTVLGYRF